MGDGKWGCDWSPVCTKKNTLLRVVRCLNKTPDRRLPVDELIQNDQLSGPDLLLERAAGGGDQQVGAAQLAQRPDVGAVVDQTGHHAMAGPVPAEARLTVAIVAKSHRLKNKHES